MDNGALEQRVLARLDQRLNHQGPEPVALALSGGGDSRALLSIAARWAHTRNRALVALTVDHRLNPASTEWTRQAAQAAESEGVAWRGLTWDAAALGSALQARARTARHALLAEAARALGAHVLLLGHTLDDVAENDWMRADGASLGRLREWSASPVWPQGRGLMLMRPLLAERRQGLRDYLAASGKGWIDDPANENPAFHRVRARQKLAGAAMSEAQADELAMFDWQAGELASYGALQFERQQIAAHGRALSSALLCAAGHDRPPRSERLQALQSRLQAGEDFVAVLAGARVQAQDDNVLIVREAGEMRRRGLSPQRLTAGRPQVWDGRFEIVVEQEGWRVEAANGWLRRLPPSARARMTGLPPCVRAVLPVVIHDGSETPYLAFEKATLTSLIASRFCLHTPAGRGETTQEAGLFAAMHSEKGSTALFSV